MGAVISYSAFKKGARSSVAKGSIDPIVGEIVHALLVLGGSAHRDMVANQIASARAGRSVTATAALRTEIIAGFQHYIGSAPARRPAPLLHLPLGDGSYRWALTDAGRGLFASPNLDSERKLH